MSTENRAAALYCPYCGEEDLRPHEHGHGSWECRGCIRVFTLRFVGLLPPAPATGTGLSGAGVRR